MMNNKRYYFNIYLIKGTWKERSVIATDPKEAHIKIWEEFSEEEQKNIARMDLVDYTEEGVD